MHEHDQHSASPSPDWERVTPALTSRATARGPGVPAIGRMPLPGLSRPSPGAGFTIRRIPNPGWVAGREVEDKDFLNEIATVIERGFSGAADYYRARDRLVQIRNTPERFAKVDPRLANRLLKQINDLGAEYQLSEDQQTAKQTVLNDVAGAERLKTPDARGERPRSVYLGNGNDITDRVTLPAAAGKKDRAQKQLDVKPEKLWAWETNVAWLRACADRFGRFKILAKLTAGELGWLRSSTSSTMFLDTIHEAYQGDERRDEDVAKDKRAAARDAGVLSDLWIGSEGRFSYLAEELALLLDQGFTLYSAKGKHFMLAPTELTREAAQIPLPADDEFDLPHPGAGGDGEGGQPTGVVSGTPSDEAAASM